MSRELAAALGAAQRPALACLQRYQQLAAAVARDARQFEAGEGVARLAELVAQHGKSWKVGDARVCGARRYLPADWMLSGVSGLKARSPSRC